MHGQHSITSFCGETLQEDSLSALAAHKECRSACIAVAIAIVCALLMLSKTAMNLRSHVKDDAWMRRVRRIFLNLQVCSFQLCIAEAWGYAGAFIAVRPVQ